MRDLLKQLTCLHVVDEKGWRFRELFSEASIRILLSVASSRRRCRAPQVLGTGIFVVDGAAWSDKRKVASHLFSTNRLRSQVRPFLFLSG